MNFWRKLYLLYVMMAGALGSPITLNGMDPDENGDIFFDSVWDGIDENAVPNIKRSITNVDTLIYCTKTFKLNEIVQKNLYLKTNPLNERNPTSLPVFLMYHSDNLNTDLLFNSYLFYNSTPKMYFTKDSTSINSYVLLDTNVLIPPGLSDVTEIEVPPVLELFQNGEIQQRRIGLMLQLLKTYKK